MRILILAGGFATRLWPLTEHRAKPLLLLDGKTILAQILAQVPPDAVVTVLTNKRFASQFQEELNHLGREEVEIFLEESVADQEKLGALGAVAAAVRHYDIQEDVLVFAGDNLLPELNVRDLIPGENEVTLAVRTVENAHEARKFGVVQADGERVLSFEEKPENPKSFLVSTGFMGFGKGVLLTLLEAAKAHPDALGEVFPVMLERGVGVRAVQVGGAWFDVGSFDTYLQAHKQLQTQEVLMGKGVEEQGNVFSGKVFLGDGCRVEGCEMVDCVVYPGCRLRDCRISNVVIDEGCDLLGVDLNQKLLRRRTHLHAPKA